MIWDVFITSVQKPPGVNKRVQSEVSSYKAEEPMPLHCDPLELWKSHQSTYPILSRLVKYYLGIPSTSVPSEKNVLSSRKNCMCTEVLAQ